MKVNRAATTKNIILETYFGIFLGIAMDFGLEIGQRTHKLVFVSWYAINLGEYLVILRHELTTMIFLLQFWPMTTHEDEVELKQPFVCFS